MIEARVKMQSLNFFPADNDRMWNWIWSFDSKPGGCEDHVETKCRLTQHLACLGNRGYAFIYYLLGAVIL